MFTDHQEHIFAHFLRALVKLLNLMLPCKKGIIANNLQITDTNNINMLHFKIYDYYQSLS